MDDKPESIMGIPIVFVDKLADLPEPEGQIIMETPNAVHYVSGKPEWIVRGQNKPCDNAVTKALDKPQVRR